MAGANRDINLSFEAAETALRGAEIFIENQPDDSLFSYYRHRYLCARHRSSQHRAQCFSHPLESIPTQEFSATAPTGVTTAPRYMIKKVGEIGDEGSLNLGGYGETDLTQKSVIYRITARGTGGNDSTQTVLRSHYARAY